MNNAWQKVWDLDTGGDFIVSSNSTLKTSIQNNPEGDDFKDDEFRIVCEATDANGDSTVIEDIDQKT